MTWSIEPQDDFLQTKPNTMTRTGTPTDNVGGSHRKELAVASTAVPAARKRAGQGMSEMRDRSPTTSRNSAKKQTGIATSPSITATQKGPTKMSVMAPTAIARLLITLALLPDLGLAAMAPTLRTGAQPEEAARCPESYP